MSVTENCTLEWMTSKMQVSVGRTPSSRLNLTHDCDAYRKAN